MEVETDILHTRGCAWVSVYVSLSQYNIRLIRQQIKIIDGPESTKMASSLTLIILKI